MLSQHTNPKSDIEIAQAAKMRPILEIAKERLGIDAENFEPYGHYKAKLSMNYIKGLKNPPNGKLILVSAITPTPAGEGKTTTTVGLTDALNHIGKKAMMCLPEPSLGPCFGVKGGAAGGAQDVKGAPVDHTIPVREVRLSAGAEFVVAICGEIVTMPGLPQVPAADAINLNADGKILGLF